MIYTSLLLLTLLLPTLYSESLCGDGEVVDLDGSCVAKVIIPSRSSCPDLSLDNGDIFLVGSGRIVQFYCDTGYVRVPDTELAICQVQGAWSKVVPVCLKQGCQIPPSPSYGSITTSYNTTLSVFSCSPSHSMSGPAILACSDGNSWNGSAPVCVEKKNISYHIIDGSTSKAEIHSAAASSFLFIIILRTCGDY